MSDLSTTNMANETDNRKLNDLRVVDLRLELEKRDLDKNGVKAVLMERLQNALKEEGHDPETYVFESSPEVKKTPGRGKKGDNDDVSEDDKGEEDEETPNSEEKDDKEITKDVTTNEVNETKENSDEKVEEPKESKKAVEEDEIKSETPAKEDSSSSNNKTDTKETTNEQKIATVNGSDNTKKDVETPVKSDKKQTKPTEVQSQEKSSDIESKTSDDVTTPDTTKKTTSDETRAKTPSASSAVKEDKSATEANGVIDNEDSINLTIGEDEAKMLADEEDSSQEKDHKDESQGSTGHKKTSVGEKSQEKTNQEKMDGKSSAAGEKAAKDEKNKKISAISGGSSRNLWVSGLATTTRATDLKQVFSKYGKVIGAKVVTNARTPGARCYGYVTMSNPDDANKAVQFLHHTELHGRLISVEKAKGDSTGPPKRSEPAKVEAPVKKAEEKKKEPIVRKTDPKKEENIVPPGTEGDLKEPDAPGTEKETSESKAESKESSHRSRDAVRSSDRPEKRPRSATSSHRSRGGSPVLTFDKIKEERERQRLRERERVLREEERRRETERMRQREIDRKQREEFERLDREKKKIKMERERLLREKDELLKLKSERQRLERERQKLEREKLEKEKEELERLKRQNMRLEEEARRKRSLSASREYESRKRPATDSRYVGHHTSSQSRYAEPPRSSEYKKESSHKTSRDIVPPPRRPGFEPETSRRLVTSVPSARESWPPKDRDRESGRYERSSVNSSSFREESISSRSKPSERLVRERYAEGPKSERFVERGDSWHGSSSAGGGAAIKSFSSRETWVSGERKPEHVGESWSRPSNNSTRWPGNSTSMGLSSRSGPQGGMSSPMFAANNIQGLSGMGVGISMGAFSGGDRFDAYKQPYFKGP